MNTKLYTSAWTSAWKEILAFMLVLTGTASSAVNLTPLPPYLSETKGAPMVMLNLSRDHQLFYKAFNEFSDLDNDGQPETQYKHSYRYYGYFDNRRCYVYSTTLNQFTPTRKENSATATDPTYCGGTDEWHGNFLNWATMTRMDVVRRILYGGLRSTDNTTTSNPNPSMTVLERAHLPTDAHAFAKYYNAADIRKLTPFAGETEITICNASFRNGRYSHNAISPPNMLVARGNFSLWNAHERWQCYWREDQALLANNQTSGNGNQPADSGINAGNIAPNRAATGLGTGVAQGTYVVRVEVCKPGLDNAASGTTGFTDDEEARCKYYPLGNYKPAGLLQKYGERNEAAFGLMTGSFNKNISGGVLRKNVATFTDEVDLDDGQFKSVDGIVKNLNSLRIYGYDYNDGGYTGNDSCDYQLVGLTEGNCVSWGNPIGEMYLESLRYLAGKSPSSEYSTSGGKDAALGLTIAAWSDPFADSTVASFGEKVCRRTSIVNFNASVTSYDNDQWTRQTDLNLATGVTVESLTESIGLAEGLYASNKIWAIGSTPASVGTASDEICNDKSIANLATATGLCPEAPTYKGGFKIAGAALHAHTRPIRNDITIPLNNKRAFKVDTYGVALATGNPRIKVPVPGQTGKFVIIQPAYRLAHPTRGQGGGALVDFRIVSQSATAGKYVIQWEDSEQGGDYDQDVWGTLEYQVTGSNIAITTRTIAQATANPQGFGYVISGTTGKDGVHFHSGILGFDYTDPTSITVTPTTNLNTSGGCDNCEVNDVATTATYAMQGVSGESLKDPLWYAAKYGGFERDVLTTAYTPGNVLPASAWDTKLADGSPGTDGTPDTFFYAIDPAQLEKSLEQIFSTILKSGGAAPAAATSSRTAAGGYVYVSTHSIKAASPGNDADASGEFLRYGFQSDGTIAGTADWDAGAKLTTQVENTGWDTARRVFTMKDSAPVPFRWANLTVTQQNMLNINPVSGVSDSRGQDRLNWLRGSATHETTAGGLRKRTKTKLGAIVNSTPWYVGQPSAGYTNADYFGGYGSFRTTYSSRNTVFVAANDGMVHAFNADTGLEQFAYVPRALYTTSSSAPYSKLSAITDKEYSLNTGTSRMNADGSVMAADINLGVAGSPNWRTYLFGTLGRGAKGVYALDVTDPTDINAETNTKASNLVKWEFTASADSDMGYITGRTNSRGNGQPTQVGFMANGKWAAIYGNGYNSTNGHAALFILFANGPASAASTTWTNTGTSPEYVKLATGTAGQGPNNGLATPTAVDTDNDGDIDVIYAGDLKGNVWKFNVSSSNVADWGVATTGSVPSFQATTPLPSAPTTLVPQPITTAIVPFAHPQGGYQLFFGTGKALESTDYPMSTVYSHSLYGIYDKPGVTGALTTGKVGLIEQTTTTVNGIRYISKNPVTYPTNKGWYLNLPVESEGMIFNAIAEDALRVNVRSLAPEGSSDGCRYDATTFDAAMNPINGIPIPNALPTAPLINGYSASGTGSLNTFEFSKGGVYKMPPPTPSNTSCVAGSANCVCNPVAASQCVICTSASTCNPPWDSGNVACTAGTPSCACNPAAPSSCVVCTNPKTCTLPWNPRGQNQCMYRTISALGSGGVVTSERFGACTDGRLTWREIQRNR